MRYFVNTYRHDDDYGLLFVLSDDGTYLIGDGNIPALTVVKTDSHVDLTQSEYNLLRGWQKELVGQGSEYENRLYRLLKSKGYYGGEETRQKECTNCFSVYPVPMNAGCTICPGCGQRSCAD